MSEVHRLEDFYLETNLRKL